jgi:hypothetical protein
MVTQQYSKKQFTDIKDIVDQISDKFAVDPKTSNLWKTRGEIQIRCPECSVKKFQAHYHLGLSFAKNAYNCFRCNFQGKLTDFLRKNGIKFDAKHEVVLKTDDEALKIKIPFNRIKDDEVEAKAYEYLQLRGFDTSFVFKNFNTIPITDRNSFYFGYLIIVLNEYAYYARKFLKLSDKHQKHFIRKSDKNMKLYYAYEKNNCHDVLICESMFNLMKATQFGYNAVCIFGKSKWGSLVEYLKNNYKNRNIILAFDSDVKMNEIEAFSKKVLTKFRIDNMYYLDIELYPCNDIAQIGSKEMLDKLVNNKKSVNDLFINSMTI